MSYHWCMHVCCVFLINWIELNWIDLQSTAYCTVGQVNKYAQSNLGRGPRRGAVEHVGRKVTIAYNGAPQICPPKVRLPADRSPNRITCFIPGPVRPMMPNGIRIRFAVFPQCTGQTDRRTYSRIRTDRQTDRSLAGKFDDYRPLRYESDSD